MRDSVRLGHQAVEWTALIDRPHTYNLQSHTPLPTQAPSRNRVSYPSEQLEHWINEELEQLTAAAAAHGHGGWLR